MSATTQLTVGGGFNGHTGLLTVPSSLLFGSATDSTSFNGILQTYLGTIYQGLVSGANDFQNNDLASPAGGIVVAGTPGGGAKFEDFTNVSSGSISAAAGGTYNASVTSGTTDVLVQIPGDVTLTGVGTTTKAVFGLGSNVNYSVVNPGAGVIDLLGGADSITLQSLLPTLNAETIYSAGTDSINMVGQGSDYVTVLGNGTLQDFGANANIVAEGSATTNFYWDSSNAGGTLHFTNNSSVAATIHIGNFNGQTSSTKVTVSGGAGGGFFVGGASGSNSLVGGSGAVTLVGAGSGDFLEAQSSVANSLFQGSGNETLVATSTTGANGFYAGLQYPGIAGNPAVSGVISTQGSGGQSFDIGNVPGGETIFGSTNATVNNYFINSGTVAGAPVGGGAISIYNFIDSRSTILLGNGLGGLGLATITGFAADQFNTGTTNLQFDIKLSDNTTILLKGLTASELAGVHTVQLFAGANGVGIVG